jgi:ribosomal protein L3 glutamine methyltransferase
LPASTQYAIIAASFLGVVTMAADYSELRTILDFIRWGASRFREAELTFAHGMSSPIDEAAYLVLYTLHLPIDTPSLYFPSTLTRTERDAVANIIEQRIETRKPAAYLTHEAWFLGLPFYVDERVLVPRSPIAEWIEKQFMPWLDPEQVTRVLDLCTGSGCIGIACSYAFPNAEVDLSDISPDALAVANLNIERHGMEGHVVAIESNLFENLSNQRYDLIVSNPPYVDAADMSDLAPEFLHEPQLGLAAGDDGLDLVHTILAEAGKHLTEQGILVVEVGNSQAALMNAYPDLDFHWLEFERGGGGIFLLNAEQLNTYFS